ncbi:hypothetical protein BP5796_11091 [Coleophoma crateriformis]|uniref:Uncharacterized protein n=1 Tax=Coleophoma crateriformis TaxID=565419 RepID=A0A3D8QLW3_9HELO|nr:hypothetical protein BP5796_11091 [Coleophoma crateriformis]
MSLSVAPAYSSGKGCDSPGSGFEQLGSDFFDQFLTFSPTDNDEPVFPKSPAPTLQEKPGFNTQSAGTSSGSFEDKLSDSIPKSCEIETLSFIQNSTSSQHLSPPNPFYLESSGKASISDNELLSLEGIKLQSPHLPDSFNVESFPLSPTPVRRRRRLVEAISKSFKKATGKSTRSPIRKASASPIMMCSSRYSQGDFDVWGQKLQLDPAKFTFDYQQQTPLSPPPSATVSSASEASMMSLCKLEQNDGFSSYSNAFPQQYPVNKPGEYSTPLTTPTLEAHHSRRPSFQQTTPETMMYPATPQFQQSHAWSQEPAPEYPTYSHSNHYASESDSPPVWWSHASAAPMAQPSPTTFHSNPQRATKSLAAQLQNELAYNANDLAMNHSGLAQGLMIQMPEDNQNQSFVVSSPIHGPLSPLHGPQGGYFNIQQAPAPSYTPTRQYTPRSQYFSSPATGHARGRSMDSSCESPSPKSASSPAFHIRKRRNPSHKGGHEPRTPSLGGGVDFVNFTPSDSKKILTGVAPSGSSKTKARREKEALEKRRRLSQAAVRAVRAAGGSVESLVEEGLFV